MSDLYHQNYEEAARMLRAPSAITVASDGALNVVDHAGKSTVVPAAQLPFVVGGDADIGMMTLPSRSNGSPVMLHLSYDGGMTRFGGKIRIESVGGDSSAETVDLSFLARSKSYGVAEQFPPLSPMIPPNSALHGLSAKSKFLAVSPEPGVFVELLDFPVPKVVSDELDLTPVVFFLTFGFRYDR
ncbi:hypothetical protein OAF70_00745 [Akkermansiaceae bacterium]|nr:hypothetical protein [Akkermansiaceae bacterium]